MEIEPIRKTITVERSPEEAFKIWTEGIGSWWPVAGHSIGVERITNVVFEPKAGGSVYEVWDDGSTHHWATVLAFDPPSRFVLEWRPNPDRSYPTEVEIRFVAEGSSTRLELEHRAWERLGDAGIDVRESYDSGWPGVLQHYVEAAR